MLPVLTTTSRRKKIPHSTLRSDYQNTIKSLLSSFLVETDTGKHKDHIDGTTGTTRYNHTTSTSRRRRRGGGKPTNFLLPNAIGATWMSSGFLHLLQHTASTIEGSCLEGRRYAFCMRFPIFLRAILLRPLCDRAKVFRTALVRPTLVDIDFAVVTVDTRDRNLMSF